MSLAGWHPYGVACVSMARYPLQQPQWLYSDDGSKPTLIFVGHTLTPGPDDNPADFAQPMKRIVIELPLGRAATITDIDPTQPLPPIFQAQAK